MTPFGVRASFEPFPFVDGGRRILGSNYGSADPATDFPRYAALHLAGRLPADRLVTGHIGLDGLEDAFAAMRRGEGVRTMIGFDRDLAPAADGSAGAGSASKAGRRVGVGAEPDPRPVRTAPARRTAAPDP